MFFIWRSTPYIDLISRTSWTSWDSCTPMRPFCECSAFASWNLDGLQYQSLRRIPGPRCVFFALLLPLIVMRCSQALLSIFSIEMLNHQRRALDPIDTLPLLHCRETMCMEWWLSQVAGLSKYSNNQMTRCRFGSIRKILSFLLRLFLLSSIKRDEKYSLVL
jgi:hypothetical protein